MAGTGSAIRIALDLVATSSGAASISSLIYAVSSLLNYSSGAAVMTEQLTTALEFFGAETLAAAVDAAIFDTALKTIVDDASQLQYSSTQMDLALHGTQAQIDALNPKIIEWADASLYTTTQVHQLVQTLSEKGMDVSAIMNGNAQAAIRFGEATNSDAVTAADTLGSALQIYSSRGMKATEVADLLTGAYYNGIPSAKELRTALEDVGGQAVTMGVSMKDLLTTLDLLRQAGMNASSGALSLRYMLQTLADPTNKAATDMNYLGLTIVNKTSPAVKHLIDRLYGAGKAGAKAADGFDGTSVGLNNMFKEAQKLGMIPLNETFNAWAISSGAMSSKLFDAKGNFLGLGHAIEQILAQVKAKSHGNKQLETVLIGDMFNVRSGRAAEILANLKNFAAQYNKVSANIGKTSAQSDANKLLNTLKGASQELNTTLTSLGAAMGAPILVPLTHLIQSINTFVSGLMKHHPKFVQFMGIFIAIGAVLSTVAAIVGIIIIVFMVVAAVVGGAVIVAFGAVLIIIIVVAAIAALIIVNWGKLTKFFQGLVKHIGDFFSHLGTAAHGLANKFKSAAILLWAEVQARFHAGIEKIKKLVSDGFAAVVGWFSWLYNHNYYFKKLVDFILIHFMALKVKAEALWHQFVSMITQKWDETKKNIANALDYVKRMLNLGWTHIAKDAQAGWKNFVSMITTNPVTKALGNIKKSIGDFMTKLGHDMLNFGSNAMQMFINGIHSQMGALGNAVGQAAHRVSSILGFHSPPREGPLSDSDQYMPNMMRMFASGIHGNIGLISGAATNAANLTRYALTGGNQGLMLGQMGMNGGNGTQVVNVSVGNQPLFQLMMNQLTGQLQINGLGRVLN